MRFGALATVRLAANPARLHHCIMTLDVTLRDATAADVPAIAAIYGHAVRTGLASFEYEPPDEAEMAWRQRSVLDAGFPYIVATDAGGQVLGYSYASTYPLLFTAWLRFAGGCRLTAR
jgi:hypothetical protein